MQAYCHQLLRFGQVSTCNLAFLGRWRKLWNEVRCYVDNNADHETTTLMDKYKNLMLAIINIMTTTVLVYCYTTLTTPQVIAHNLSFLLFIAESSLNRYFCHLFATQPSGNCYDRSTRLLLYQSICTFTKYKIISTQNLRIRLGLRIARLFMLRWPFQPVCYFQIARSCDIPNQIVISSVKY